MNRTTRRRLVSATFVGACGLAVLVALVPLVMVLFFVVSQGVQALNVEFFTHMPRPVGEPGGGMLNAIVGTLILIGLASAIAIPVGVISGIYMAEYAGTRLATIVRFAADTLNGVPSIVIGIFVYGIAVLPFRQFSALAGGLALGIMMIPIIARTTEELLRLVPDSLREAAVALGCPRWKMVTLVSYRAAGTGIATGVLLALARVAGETAPLLFTALNNQFWSSDMARPMANLPVVIFQFAMSPYEDWHRLAWGGAALITCTVLAVNIFARALLPRART